MSKKIVETQRLESFLQATGRHRFPVPEVGESPDFLFVLDQHTLGIELTNMVSPRVPCGDNPRQSARVLERLTGSIERHYTEFGGLPAHVSIFFRQGLRVRREQEARLAQELATEFVAGIDRSLAKHPSRVPIEVVFRHPAVRSIAAWPCRGGEQPRWHVHRGGVVDRASAVDVVTTVRGKEPKLARYRTRADEIWLLIVCDLFADGLLINPPAEPVSFTVSTGFDRLFCLAWTGSYAVEVPVLRTNAS